MEEKILRAAGKRGKSKTEIAEALGVSTVRAGAEVNKLVAEGKLRQVAVVKTGKRGRPYAKFARAE